MTPSLTPALLRGFILATLVEIVGLHGWLLLVEENMAVVGIVLLFIGLLAERFFVVRASRLNIPWNALVVSAIVETVIWIVWLAIAESGGDGVGFIFLAIGITVEHSLQLNLAAPRGLLFYVSNIRVLTFSLVEAAGSALWLVVFQDQPLVSVAVIAITITLEHTLQGLLTQNMEVVSPAPA